MSSCDNPRQRKHSVTFLTHRSKYTYIYWELVLLLCVFCRVLAIVAELKTSPLAGRWTPTTFYGITNNNPVPRMKLASSTDTAEGEDLVLLLSFKESITGDPMGALQSWKNGSSHCSWKGVTCSEDGFVSIVNLTGLELSGPLSPSLFLLPRLKLLDLSDNLLEGPLPSSPCNPNSSLSLSILNLKNNSFFGAIPRSLGNCTSLTSISLYSNSLSGSIPPELSSLSNLTYLALSFNQLNGSIPISILTNCTKLTLLALSLNEISGPLPREIGKLRSMQTLWLDNNYISGEIPPELGNLTQLTLLQLDTNNLEGSIPRSLGQLASLTELLSLSMNQLSGPIPPELSKLSNLTIITLRGNHLNGTIPKELGSMQSIQGLFLEENMLGGTIPVELANCKSLQRLRLDNNRLIGSIPNVLGSLPHLFELYVHANMLEGLIPNSLAGLSSLQDLSLGFNALSGPIPPSLASLETIIFNFSFPHNLLNGTIPSGLGQLIHVQNIDLSANNISGTIPEGIGDCANLVQLNLSYNSLTGEIPESFQLLIFLEVLDLSANLLFGGIPVFLANLTQLQYINLSYNNLSGPIPSSGVFAKTNASSFVGNPGLCGSPSTRKCPTNITALQPSSQEGGLKVGIKILIAVFSALSVFVLFLVLFPLLLALQRRKKTYAASSSGMLNESVLHYSKYLRRFTAKELEVATDNFCEARLIGAGGASKVYRATNLTVRLAPTIQQVDAAVKVLSMDHNLSFLGELKALGSIKHRNLVKFYGFCEFGNLQAFVLQLLPNGSLKDQLYAPDAPSLSISMRLRIALDVAHGLAYLHHGLKNQIVHRDVKPSNILFDEGMVAKVADFGIAKFLDQEEMYTNAKGTLGYVAPEYGESASVNAKGDVYSFGIVMLEMLTRKEPTDTMFQTLGVSLPIWVRKAYPARSSEILDPQLRDCVPVSCEDDEAIQAMLELALFCTEMKPDDRPDMETVVKKLTSFDLTLSCLVTEKKSSMHHEKTVLLKK